MLKIRWLFPAGVRPSWSSDPRRSGRLEWQAAELVIEAEGEANAKIAVYNGLIAGSASGPGLDRPGIPANVAAERGLQPALASQGRPDTLAISAPRRTGDGRGGRCVDRRRGLRPRLRPPGPPRRRPAGLAEYRRKIVGPSTILARVRKMPDQSFDQAMRALWPPIQNNGPTMLSLACDNEKFISSIVKGRCVTAGSRSSPSFHRVD